MSILNELKTIKSGKKELKKFGITIAMGLVILGGILYIVHHRIFPVILWQIPVLSIILAFTFPVILWPFQKFWMAISVILGFFMTRLILGVLFYLILTPLGLISKLFGNDFLNLKQDRDAVSYWNRRTVKKSDQSMYENQF